jgi:peptidoglycan/xylan/chitin deacetylase (PgdA/CDA1 family)
MIQRRSKAQMVMEDHVLTDQRYSWPEGYQCAVVLSFDVDAESALYFRQPERAKRSLAALEERRFGPRVGVPRILKLLETRQLKATFAIPGWTVEHHTDVAKRIRDAGHEIMLHGNVHEALDHLDETQERAVLKDALDIMQSYLGIQPKGYRSPSWDLNVWTPTVLKQAGLDYDSSLMGNDIPYDVATPHGPLTEIPVQWLLDDAPFFRHVYGATNAIAEPDRVLRFWCQEFNGMYYANGCFVVTCHPWISGRAARMAMLDDLIGTLKTYEGVWFTTLEAVAHWHMVQPRSREGGTWKA